ncbi:MAG: aquaporin, partial [Verrucomicrobiota bacterium]|nr:aquaporin [Verrucomicrobiota bacterium]
PGIELLHYEAPETSNIELAANDLSAWRIDIETGRREASRERSDPDGHALLVEERPEGASPLEYPLEALRQHWPRYFMEGVELGIFMAVALFLALALEHPKSRLHKAIAAPLLRRFIFGLGIGGTVILLIYSPWGRQSGAHFNPAVTLSMLYLKRIQAWDAFFYIIAQFIGGWLGVVLAAAPFRQASAQKDVNYVVTEPGKPGVVVAFIAEFVISFILMATLRLVYQSDQLKPFLGYFAGFLLLVYITFESPLSGMSLNPARSVASAIPARNWKAIWIYFAAPILAMLLAAIVCG